MNIRRDEGILIETMSRLSLGLDVSTQSFSAVVLDIDTRTVIAEHSLDYLRDERLNGFGIRQEDYILLPDHDGEANQPAMMFLAGLDAMLSDLKTKIDVSQIAVINVSGQQHGHVYLSNRAGSLFGALRSKGCGLSDLVTALNDSFAWDAAPIWLTSDTGEQADFIREFTGGKEKVIELSGADVPLRFTGIVIRRTGQAHPDIYRNTKRIQLISSLIPAVLCGDAGAPMDYGNGSGMSLMDYRKRDWSDELLAAAADGLPGGVAGLRAKLPDIVKPDTVVGKLAGYFIEKYGMSPDCLIAAGSGDNPQSKVLVTGDLLSLGTSIVNMVSTDGATVDLNGYASAMYDGLGRPFMFGTRTNGVLLWDRLRATWGMEKKEYEPAEEGLRKAAVGSNLLFWQARRESFPPSEPVEMTRVGDYLPDMGTDYSALIETTLAAVCHYSRGFTRDTAEALYVTGGARNSREILRRVAAIWNRPVIPIEVGGAALGAAVAGVSAWSHENNVPFDAAEFMSGGLMHQGDEIVPKPEDVAAFHGEGGFLERFEAEERKLLFS